MSYATGSDLIARYDIDVVGQLAWDEREELDREVIATHANVLTALEDASGEIDVKLIAGGRYTPAQLSALTGNSLSLLKRITCAIAMSCLFERRPSTAFDELAEKVAKQSRDWLKSLASGDNVFGIPDAANGQAAVMVFDTVSAIDIENRNLMTARMPRYFPSTAQRTPRD